jgi:hypothetical protein
MPVSGWLSWLARSRQRESDGVNCSPITLTEGNSTGSSEIRKVEPAYIPFASPVVKPGYAVIFGCGPGWISPLF